MGLYEEEKNNNATVALSDDALEQATGGYYEVYFNDGTSKKINADGSEYKTAANFKQEHDLLVGTLFYDRYTREHKQRHTLEDTATFKEI